MSVYIDRVFALNLTVDYLLFLAVARLAGTPLRRLRFALCGVGGGLYASAVFLPAFSWMAGPLCKLAMGLFLAWMAFHKDRKSWKLIGLFFLLSGALAGVILAVGLCVGAPDLLLGRIYRAEIDWPLLIGGTLALSTVLHLIFRQGARHIGGELMTILVSINGKEKSFTVLYDSGNTLRNPIDGRPVLVLEQPCVIDLLPEAEADILRQGGSPEISMAGLYATGSHLHFSLLPFRSVGTDTGLLLAVRSDYIQIHRRKMPRILIALAPGAVSDGGGYCGLWGGMEGRTTDEKAAAADQTLAAANRQAG